MKRDEFTSVTPVMAIPTSEAIMFPQVIPCYRIAWNLWWDETRRRHSGDFTIEISDEAKTMLRGISKRCRNDVVHMSVDREAANKSIEEVIRDGGKNLAPPQILYSIWDLCPPERQHILGATVIFIHEPIINGRMEPCVLGWNEKKYVRELIAFPVTKHIPPPGRVYVKRV